MGHSSPIDPLKEETFRLNALKVLLSSVRMDSKRFQESNVPCPDDCGVQLDEDMCDGIGPLLRLNLE